MKQEKKNDVAVLLEYAGSRRGLTFLGLVLSAVSMLSGFPWLRMLFLNWTKHWIHSQV